MNYWQRQNRHLQNRPSWSVSSSKIIYFLVEIYYFSSCSALALLFYLPLLYFVLAILVVDPRPGGMVFFPLSDLQNMKEMVLGQWGVIVHVICICPFLSFRSSRQQKATMGISHQQRKNHLRANVHHDSEANSVNTFKTSGVASSSIACFSTGVICRNTYAETSSLALLAGRPIPTAIRVNPCRSGGKCAKIDLRPL